MIRGIVIVGQSSAVMWRKSVVTAAQRAFSSGAEKAVSSPAVKTPGAISSSNPGSKSGGGGSTFFQRLSSFLAGCGVGFGVSSYFIYEELVESNEKLERSIKQIADSK